MNTNTIDNVNGNFISQNITEDINTTAVTVKSNPQNPDSKILDFNTFLGSSVMNEVPDLPKPNVAGKSQDTLKALSEEAIMTMLGSDVRESQKQSITLTLKTNAQLRKSENAKIIENLQKQADKINEEKKMSFWEKLFKVIGAVIGIIAGVASIAITGGASTPLLVAACLSIAMGVESVVSEATDGKVSLSALTTKVFGEDAGPWVAMGLQIALTLASVGTGIAGALKSAETATTAFKVLSTIQGIGTGLTGTASAVTTGLKASTDYDLAMLKAESKRIQAMLNELGSVDEREVRRLREILENASSTVEKVKDIVDSSNEALTATATA